MTPAVQRFQDKVTFVPLCGCHLWTASTTKFGYGKLSVGDGKWQLAHRFAFEQANGEIPEGKFVLHKCDTPSCVNPDHLYLGSKKDNATDRESRNRGNHAFGVRHGRSKLMPSQVLEIRDVFDTGKYTFKQLGKIYGIDGKSVADIVDRRNWTSVH